MAYKRKWVTRHEAARMIGCEPQTVSNYIADGTLTGRKRRDGIVMVSAETIGIGAERFRKSQGMGRVKKPCNPRTKLALAVQWNDGDCVMNHNICLPQYYVTPLRETDEDSIEDMMVALEEAARFDHSEIHVFTDPGEYTATARMYRRFSAHFIPKKEIFNEQ